MTDVYAVESSSFARTAESPMVSNLLSALLIVGVPTAFWMGVLELANLLFALDLSLTVRFGVGGALVTVLSVVWCFAVLSARQTEDSETREAAIERVDTAIRTELY